MPRLYLSIRRLCVCCYPLKITRRGDFTLEVCDPTATKAEIVERCIDLMEPWENDAGRAAFGQPSIGGPISDDLLSGLCLPYVPPGLRVPGEPAIQVEEPTAPGPALDAYEEALMWWASEFTNRRQAAG